jgi:CDGSH-type Zn-finger protein
MSALGHDDHGPGRTGLDGSTLSTVPSGTGPGHTGLGGSTLSTVHSGTGPSHTGHSGTGRTVARPDQRPRPPAQIVPCADGPLLVRGAFEIAGTDDARRPTRNTVALCRCGTSVLKPFCDGSHKLTGFRTTPPPSDA